MIYPPNQRLFPAYAGSKGDPFYLPKIWDCRKYDSYCDPFVGGGDNVFIALSRGIPHIWIADSDILVRSVWETWLNPALHTVFQSHLGELWTRLNETIHHTGGLIEVTKKGKKSIAPNSVESCKAVFNCVKKDVEHDIEKADTPRIAAKSMFLRSLAFGSVMRGSKNKRINVSLAKEKVYTFLQMGYRLPPVPDSSYQVHLFSDAMDCINAFVDSNPRHAISLLDPPYSEETIEPIEVDPDWARKRKFQNRMTPAYIVHSPLSDAQLAIASLEALVTVPNIRISAWNYIPETGKGVVDEAYKSTADRLNLRIGQEVTGKLGTISRNDKGEDCKIPLLQKHWEFGDRVDNQLSLFDVA